MEEKNKPAWIIGLIVILFLIGGFGMGGGMMGSGFGMGFGVLFMLLFWGSIIWLVYVLTDTVHLDRGNRGETDPLKILHNRYANGEIGQKEYVKVKKELSRK